MVSPQGSDKFRTKFKVEMFDHDPGGTGATLVSPDGGTTVRSVDMRDNAGLFVGVMTSALGGNGVTKVELVAADNAALSTNLVVIKDSGVVAADAVGDVVTLFCTQQEIAQESADGGYTSRYAGARITCHHTDDEAVVTFIGTGARFPRDGLTPDTTIA